MDKRQESINWWFSLPLIKRRHLSAKYYPNQTFKAVQRTGAILETIHNQENN